MNFRNAFAERNGEKKMEKRNYYDPEYVAQRQAEYAAKVAKDNKAADFRKKVVGFVFAFVKGKVAM